MIAKGGAAIRIQGHDFDEASGIPFPPIITREEITACREEALRTVHVPPDIVDLLADLREHVQVSVSVCVRS